MLLSRFLMKMLPTPDFLSDGSRCDHMIRMGRPLIVSKFIVSMARSAVKIMKVGKWINEFVIVDKRYINLKFKNSGLKGPAILTVCRLLKIDVGVAQGFSGDHIPADTDGQDRARL